MHSSFYFKNLILLTVDFVNNNEGNDDDDDALWSVMIKKYVVTMSNVSF